MRTPTPDEQRFIDLVPGAAALNWPAMNQQLSRLEKLPLLPPEAGPTDIERSLLKPVIKAGASTATIMALCALLRRGDRETFDIIERTGAVLLRRAASRRPVAPVRRPDGDRGFSVRSTEA